METSVLIITIILFIVGLLGTILPILPGAILIYGGMIFYGFMTQFQELNGVFFLIQGLILAFIFLIDYLAAALGTKRFGGSKQTAWGAVIGTILGVITFNPLGILLGPFLGAFAVELLRGSDINAAMRVGFGTVIGLLGGTLVKLGIEIIMIIYFFIRI